MSRQGICVFSHYGVGQHFGYSELNNIRCLFSQLLFCRDKKTSLVFCFFFPLGLEVSSWITNMMHHICDSSPMFLMAISVC